MARGHLARTFIGSKHNALRCDEVFRVFCLGLITACCPNSLHNMVGRYQSIFNLKNEHKIGNERCARYPVKLLNPKQQQRTHLFFLLPYFPHQPAEPASPDISIHARANIGDLSKLRGEPLRADDQLQRLRPTAPQLLRSRGWQRTRGCVSLC